MSGKGLELVVLVCPVHDCLNPVVIEPGGKRIVPSSMRWILNPFDAFALEEALRLRDAVPDTRVSVMTVASSDSEAVLRECLAAGSDEGVRIWDDRMEGSDPHATASILAAALRNRCFDLALCGWRRADLEHGQVGPALAALLGLPQVTGARRILPAQDRSHVFVHKRIPGFLTRLRCPLPAVISLEKGQPLRYPRYADRRHAAKAAINRLDLRAIGLAEEEVGVSGSLTEVERYTAPKPSRRSAMASAAGRMSAAARLQRIMSGGVQEKKDGKMWECRDRESARKVAEHILKEKMILL